MAGSGELQVERVVGRGTFGIVYKGLLKRTGEVVAVKKVFQDQRYKNRELALMQLLVHPNIIQVKHHFYTQSTGDSADLDLNIVMDFYPKTLFELTEKLRRNRETLRLTLVKLYTYQLLRALAQCHACRVVHRDIKPQNLLINPQDSQLKLCDFGSAKELSPVEGNISYICSRYYRAPELVFGSRDYTTAVDIWSAGCVMAEMLLGKPLFPGENSSDLLVKIIQTLGTPTKEDLYNMNPYYRGYAFPHVTVKPLAQQLAHCTENTVDFLASLLVYSPGARPTALECLQHPFFDELRRDFCSDRTKPELFNWTAEETSSVPTEVLIALTPTCYTRI